MAKILVIDDQEPTQALLRTVLEEEGHEVIEAGNGYEGLSAYLRTPAHLVITDVLMPEMNGLDLILEVTHCFLDIKVIAMTGEADGTDMLARARLLGARHTLQKPFCLEKFKQIVRSPLR